MSQSTTETPVESTKQQQPSRAISLVPVAEAVRKLLHQDLPPHQFFSELLKALTSDAPAAIAAAWMVGPAQSLGLFAEVGLTACGMLENKLEFQSNQELLLKAWQSDESLWLDRRILTVEGPRKTLLLPARKAGKNVGVVQLICDEINWEDLVEQAAASEIMELVERYLQRVEEQTRALDPATFQSVFIRFTEHVHESLNPLQVARTAVQETCDSLGCDRAWLWERRGRRWTMQAVNGQHRVRQSSPQVRILKTLLRQVAPLGRRFTFTGDGSELPDEVSHLLLDYLQESGVQMLVVEPLFRSRSNSGQDAIPSRHDLLGVLICEQFQDNLPAPGLIQHLPGWSNQIAIALKNARDHQRLVAIPGIRWLGAGYDGIKSSKMAICLSILLAGTAILAGLLNTQQELRIRSRGHLMPVIRRQVYASAEGEVKDVLVQEAEVVKAGQPLIRLYSPDLELQLLTYTSQLQERIQSRNAIRSELREALSGRNRDESARLQAQFESISIDIEATREQLKLLAAAQSKLIITAPIAGTITTRQPRSRWLNRPVERGETLLEIMDETGPWQLELEIPERRAGHVLTQFQQAPGQQVTYRLTARPEQVQTSQLTSIADRTALSSEYGTAIHAVCEIQNQQLPWKRIGADVSAQISCGPHSMMYVYFGEFWEFLQRQWWL